MRIITEVNQIIQTAVDHDIKPMTPVLSELPTHLHQSQHTLVSEPPDSIGYSSSSPEKSKHENSSHFVSSTAQVSSHSKTEATPKLPLASKQVIKSTNEEKCKKLPCNNINLDKIDKCPLVTNLVTEDSKLPVKSRVEQYQYQKKVLV